MVSLVKTNPVFDLHLILNSSLTDFINQNRRIP